MKAQFLDPWPARGVRLAVLAACCGAAATAGAAMPQKPPLAPVIPHVTDYYGTRVIDDYRWMEKPGSKRLAKFMREQNAYTRAMLARIPGRAQLAREIDRLSNADTGIYWLDEAGSKYFYLQVAPGENTAALYVRDGLAGPGRMLIDPMRFSRHKVPQAINFYQPSPDGRYVAYGVSAGGSEQDTLRVIDVASGKNMDVAISRVDGSNGEFQPVFWAPDGKSFFYYRLRHLAKSSPASAFFEKSRVYLHVLGQYHEGAQDHGDQDRPVFGYGVSKDVAVEPDQDAVVVTMPGSPYAFGVLTENESSDVIDAIYAAPMADVLDGNAHWTEITGKDDQVAGFAAHGGKIDILTAQDAPRYKVVQTSLGHPSFDTGKVLVPQGAAIINQIALARDGLYVQTMRDGMGGIVRVPFSEDTPQTITVPFKGSIGGVVASPDRDGILFHMDGWTQAPQWYAYDPASRKVTDTGLQPPSKADFSRIEAVEKKAVSADGTMVPVSILMKQGLTLDGSHPALLIGYGSYGITITPFFAPEFLPWLNRGGIIAVAHVRGGGWYGDAWHKAGMKLAKMNTVYDFIACAHYLIDHHYTSAVHLAGEGGSAGGITIGRAIEMRPHLFAAVVDSHGETDTLRSEFTPNGPPNISEFGSVKTEAGFHGLYAMSAQVHLRKGVDYPAVLLETGANDPRVEPWEVAKFAAGLQADSASGKPVLLRVSDQSGHGIGSTRAQENNELADEQSFLLWQLGAPGFQPRN